MLNCLMVNAENISDLLDLEPALVVEAALQAGKVHDVIVHLEEGYDTQIGPGGKALSGGER